MQRRGKQDKHLKNTTKESQVGRSGKNAEERISGPSSSSWTDSEIRVFLMEWEGVEQQVGHPGKMVHKKTSALCQRLSQWGLKKSWTSCFYLLLSLQDLHRILCTERPRVEPLFSHHKEALYRILGPCVQESFVPGPLCDGSGDPLFPCTVNLPGTSLGTMVSVFTVESFKGTQCP